MDGEDDILSSFSFLESCYYSFLIHIFILGKFVSSKTFLFGYLLFGQVCQLNPGSFNDFSLGKFVSSSLFGQVGQLNQEFFYTLRIFINSIFIS